MRKLLPLYFACLVLSLNLRAGEIHGHRSGSFKFAENKGQWEPSVRFRADIPAGELYLEDQSIIYVFRHEEDLRRIHKMGHGQLESSDPSDFNIRGHCFKMHFRGSHGDPIVSGDHKTPDYVNYYLGNDPQRWASGVNQYEEVNYDNIYAGIDFRMYSKDDNLKYDLIVAPGADASVISLEYEGVESIFLRYNQLHIKTSVNELVEQTPFAYQVIEGRRQPVRCEFTLKGNRVGFAFPEGYNTSYELVIDPLLIFSSYTGATNDNWGFTATYDNAGNLYGGGIVMNGGLGYPAVGAFQAAHAGGHPNAFSPGVDIGISKFSSDGTSLIYSTYLGGSGNEAPHSLVVDNSGNLVVMGSTSSPNFPTTASAFDRTFAGGDTVQMRISLLIWRGSDIFVTKFSPAGNTLIGSTYIGGTENDGFSTSSLLKNYGDEFRGEVIVDASGNVYVASITSSTNFPIISGFQTGYGGGDQDGVVFKFNPALTTLIWSTYLGGTGSDATYSLQFTSGGNVVVAGGTNSFIFPTTSGALFTSPRGGIDGFISILGPAGNSLVASTYIGTSAYDQNFFVQLDDGDSVYVVGQTEGNYAVTPPGVFTQPNGGQYIHKLTPNLDSTVFSMRFGTNRPAQVDIALSAFLVNDCDHIYVSGWGGGANALAGAVPGSTTNGLQVTPGAHRPTTDGGDFYLIALAENADSVIYATFFGGNNGAASGEHCDGGTSRFDKKGIVYQAVCACGGAAGTFPTTTGAWAETNGSNNCNLGVIKFDMSKPHSSIKLSSPPYVCIPGTVTFGNQSKGTDYFWDFGDGTTSTIFAPTHFYSDTGTYTVMLVVSDSALCVITDTSYVVIRGVPPPNAEIQAVTPVCQGTSVQLSASGGTSWKWIPAAGLSDDTIQNPVATPDSSTTYMLIVSDTCGSDTAEIRVEVFEDETVVMDDTTICLGQSLQMDAQGGVSYLWSGGVVSNPTIGNPIAKPTVNTSYFIDITDANGCTWRDTVKVEIDPDIPFAEITKDTVICYGENIQLSATGGKSYKWEPAKWLDNPNVSDPIAAPLEGTIYTVMISNACGTVSDDVYIEVDKIQILSIGDSVACAGRPARLTVVGADFFKWEPSEFLNLDDIPNPTAIINKPTLFHIHGINVHGCEADTTFLLGIRPAPYLEAGNDILLNWGRSIFLEPEGQGKFFWQPPYGLNCERCENPLAKPETTTKYYVTMTDEFGCVANDSLTIFVTGSIFVPNAFTPDGDGHNDFFRILANEMAEIDISIYNRWGELLFHTTNANSYWDGTYNGNKVPNDSYVWKIKYVEISGKKGEERGLVNLIR